MQLVCTLERVPTSLIGKHVWYITHAWGLLHETKVKNQNRGLNLKVT